MGGACGFPDRGAAAHPLPHTVRSVFLIWGWFTLMTGRGIRKTTALVLLALYGAVTLGAAALHALPGCSHARPTGPPSEKAGPLSSGPTADECPACHFLALAQLPAVRPHIAHADVARPGGPDEAPAVFAAVSRIASHPRAPPRPL